jgi:hypothetical protein
MKESLQQLGFIPLKFQRKDQLANLLGHYKECIIIKESVRTIPL